MVNLHIGRNDPCWCGSGAKYKKCHLERERERPLPTAALMAEFRHAKAWKTCLHPAAAPEKCSKIIDAHTVQRAKTMEELVDATNHVLTFYPYTPDESTGLPQLLRRGWRQASTFTGFCAFHDSVTFAPIETSDQIPDTERAFLFSYRALCHELYQKITVQQATKAILRSADRGMPVDQQAAIQHTYAVASAGRGKAILNLREVKELADTELQSANYNGWSFTILLFDGPLSLATSGVPTPNQDFDGRELQVLHDPSARVEHLYVSIASVAESRVAVVLGWRRQHVAPERLVQSLLSRDRDMIASYLVQYVFAHLENVYFADWWWSDLSPEQQAHIRGLAGNSNPYYFVPHFLQTRLVPWELSIIYHAGRVAGV